MITKQLPNTLPRVRSKDTASNGTVRSNGTHPDSNGRHADESRQAEPVNVINYRDDGDDWQKEEEQYRMERYAAATSAVEPSIPIVKKTMSIMNATNIKAVEGKNKRPNTRWESGGIEDPNRPGEKVQHVRLVVSRSTKWGVKKATKDGQTFVGTPKNPIYVGSTTVMGTLAKEIDDSGVLQTVNTSRGDRPTDRSNNVIIDEDSVSVVVRAARGSGKAGRDAMAELAACLGASKLEFRELKASARNRNR